MKVQELAAKDEDEENKDPERNKTVRPKLSTNTYPIVNAFILLQGSPDSPEPPTSEGKKVRELTAMDDDPEKNKTVRPK